MITRRTILAGAGAFAAPAVLGSSAHAAATQRIGFEDLYEGGGVLGLVIGRRIRKMNGAPAAMRGYMAPPLKAESEFFVLTREPVSICPFCSSDAEWPADIVVIYLRRQAAPTRFSDPIEATGRLEVGSHLDPVTGFLSQIRLVDAEFRRA